MASHPGSGSGRPRRDRARRRRLCPSLHQLESRVAPSLIFPGISGVAFDTSGDVFVSYNSTTPFSGQQQSVAEVSRDGFLLSASVFGTVGASAFPGALVTVGSSASLPNVNDASDILELQPDGQYVVYDPATGTASRYDSLHAARWTSRDLRARRIQPFLRYGKRSNADCPETRSDRRAQYRKRRDHG